MLFLIELTWLMQETRMTNRMKSEEFI
jgi:hypothetical protein